MAITITDDGVGMTAERAAELLSSRERVDKGSMTGIGLGNVDRRLKLAYGKGAGLAIDSVPGAYTRVSVRIGRECDEP